MKKRILAIAAAAMFCATGALAGCATNRNKGIQFKATKEEVASKEITFIGYKHEDKDLVAIENSIHSFMDINPTINVNYEGLKNDDSPTGYIKIFDLRYRSGNLDDVFMIKQTDYFAAMRQNNDLLNISGDLNLNAYTDLVQSQIVNTDGSVYFVPMALSVYGLYINYDLLKADKQNVPTNFEEFEKVCNFYVAKYASEGKNLTPIICNSNRSLRTIVQAYGTYDLYRAENSTAIVDGFNTDPTPLAENYLKNGLEFAKNMLEKKWIDPQAALTLKQTNISEGGDMYEFMKGEQPFMITGAWATNRISGTTVGKKMNYGIHPLPFLSKEQGGSVLLYDVDICTAVNAKSKNLNEARKFISYFTNPASVWDFCNSNNSLSPLAAETRLPDDKTLQPHIKHFTSGGPSVLGTNYRIKGIDINKIIDNATKSLLNGESVDTAYNAMYTEFEKSKQGGAQ